MQGMACFVMTVWLLSALLAGAGEPAFVKPTANDKCPVCGMFVAKYPDWTAQAVLRGGTRVFFDGPKDLFKFLLDVQRYAPGKGQSDIDTVTVTDYYGVRPINGRTAFYILGSDVYGPMGRELIPFEKEAAAREFLKDHAGKKILRFRDITPEVLKELD